MKYVIISKFELIKLNGSNIPKICSSVCWHSVIRPDMTREMRMPTNCERFEALAMQLLL